MQFAGMVPTTRTSLNLFAKFLPLQSDQSISASDRGMMSIIPGVFISISIFTILSMLNDLEANSRAAASVSQHDMYWESALNVDPWSTWSSILILAVGSFALKPLFGSSSGRK